MVWKFGKKEKKKKKKVWFDGTQCKISPKCEKEKRKKGNILLQYFENNAKIWEILATFWLFF